ncbi:(2,3-dihydroxybenzoyl)adenylate synthase [Actinomadura decatromicini]|uniref:AMP-binding protein n=1 Tax=Actinomadura decatromicini TaxID=2604572 RepID=A0A5D3F875_9ACTN|nr:AMP-binding protein [Actinomadura decatromicini]TYK44016.1 AMP-binding protein [Actinomadura decatromicini]
MIAGCVPWPAETAERYRALGLWTGQTLDVLLSAHGERTALVSGSTRRTYRELAERAARLATGFHGLGLRRGDRVIVQMPNTPELIDTLFALLTLGAAPVLALPPHRRDEIGHLAVHTEAAAYVIPDVHQGFDHRELARQVRGPRHVIVAGEPEEFESLASLYAEPTELPPPEPGDVAFFLLSGGTTGRAKLIPRTHDDYMCNIRLSADNARLGPDDVYLAALPIAHNYALGCPGVLGTFYAGGSVVLSPTPSVGDAFPLIEDERVTVTGLVPSLALLWVDAASWSPHDLSSLRLVQLGGAGVSPDLARDVGRRLGPVQQSFGMAEGLLSQSPPDDPPELLTSLQGKPLSAHDEVRIVDEAGDDVPPGETGELLVRGPYTIRGYFRAEEHNGRAFTPDGFFRTGDLARRTETGHLEIRGRVKDVINRGADKVPADEVEEHLLAHPDVRAAAVVPVPDPYLGERTCAYIVARDEPPTLRTVAAFMRERGVADYKIPDRVVVVPGLPLTPVGKVDKARLQKTSP